MTIVESAQKHLGRNLGLGKEGRAGWGTKSQPFLLEPDWVEEHDPAPLPFQGHPTIDSKATRYLVLETVHRLEGTPVQFVGKERSEDE